MYSIKLYIILLLFIFILIILNRMIIYKEKYSVITNSEINNENIISNKEISKIKSLQNNLEMNDIDKNYWINVQKKTSRNLISIQPLNCLVHKICNKLLVKQHIIWIGGPPGVGKTTCTRRFQNYGFMALDCEDPWNLKEKSRLSGLINMTHKVKKELNSSFVFGSCYGNYLKKAPEFVIPVLLFPTFDIYQKRWKKRNPNDKQSNNKRYKLCENIYKNNKNNKILVVHQPVIESVDVTIYRICEMILNK